MPVWHGLSEPLDQAQDESSQIVVGDQREQQEHRHESCTQNVVPRLHAERTAFHRLEEIHENLASVENWYRQEVEHGQVHAYQRDQQKKILEASARRLHRSRRNHDWPAELARRHLSRGEALERTDYSARHAPRDAPALDHRIPESDIT